MHASDGDVIVVPGKVLGTGDLNRKVTVAAFSFSKSAVEKIRNAKGNVSKNLDLMIVSNSIYQPEHEKIEVIPLEDFFAEAIYRTNEGKSLSELF